MLEVFDTRLSFPLCQIPSPDWDTAILL